MFDICCQKLQYISAAYGIPTYVLICDEPLIKIANKYPNIVIKQGTDQKASLEPHDFKDMVDNIYKTLCVLGNSFMTVYTSEEKVKEKLRK